jgi:hypothetical protein
MSRLLIKKFPYRLPQLLWLILLNPLQSNTDTGWNLILVPTDMWGFALHGPRSQILHYSRG